MSSLVCDYCGKPILYEDIVSRVKIDNKYFDFHKKCSAEIIQKIDTHKKGNRS